MNSNDLQSTYMQFNSDEFCNQLERMSMVEGIFILKFCKGKLQGFAQALRHSISHLERARPSQIF